MTLGYGEINPHAKKAQTWKNYINNIQRRVIRLLE